MTSTSRKIEMTWVCTSCGHRNLGRFKDCQQCGNPKDASERFEMPGDTSAAQSVVDPRLLAHARAGADWRCAYCGTDNRALEPKCVQCGAERGGIPANALPQGGALPGMSAIPARATPRRAAWTAFGVVLAASAALVVFGCCGLMAVGAMFGSDRAPLVELPPPQPEILSATVVAREWTCALRTERHQLVDREGFEEQRPAGALDVAQDGARHHHDEQVQDGTQQETYFEDVPYADTETYTESVACGEDCTEIPETCSEHCTDDGNGFATCTTSCTGGGRSCTPRTCSETRTRAITRTRSEARTRTVPRYRSEPRDAPWFRWREWAWVPSRRAERRGTVEDPEWPPDEELGELVPFGEGEEERILREGSGRVNIADVRGRPFTITPATVDDLARYPIGATLQIEVSPEGTLLREVTAPVPPDAGITSVETEPAPGTLDPDAIDPETTPSDPEQEP